MKKEKILISLIAVVMVLFAIGNIVSLATEGNENKMTITAATGNSTNNEVKNEALNETVGVVNQASNTTNKTKNETNTVNNVVNNTNKVVDNTNKANTVSSTRLPKAGTDSTVIFLTLGFVASAIYAYKKISDYNV